MPSGEPRGIRTLYRPRCCPRRSWRRDRAICLPDAYREAWTRGEAWQEAILSGLVLMPDNGKLALANALGVTVDRLGKA